MGQEIRLKVIGGPLDSKRFIIDERISCIVGRADDCNIVISREVDITISRHHCLLDINPPVIIVRDLGSVNGTFLNENRLNSPLESVEDSEATMEMLSEYIVNHNDKLKIGETVFQVKILGKAHCINCKLRISVTKLSVNWRNNGCFQCEACYLKEQKAYLKSIKNSNSRNYTLLSDDTQIMDQDFVPIQSPLEIDGYKFIRRLGQGGMGVVYLANKETSEETLAVKILQAKAFVDQYLVKSFLREVDNTRSLNHDNIIKVMDSGYSNGHFYFSMEYCPEGDLTGMMKKRGGHLDIEEAFELMLQILDGLEHAHNIDIASIKLENGQTKSVKGLIHRDIKPDNIFISHKDGKILAKIADFGLSKAFDTAGMSGCTMTGKMAGSPKFMSRSLLTNFKYSKPDIDIWAAVATFYYMLTNKCPRDFSSGVDPLRQILETNTIPIRKYNPDVPENLAEIIDFALNEDGGLHFKSAIEFKEAMLEAIK